MSMRIKCDSCGMTDLPPDVWVPIKLRWRCVQPGDVIVGKDGRLGHVRVAAASTAIPAVFNVSADFGDENYTRPVDPDAIATVLVPAVEKDFLNLTRAQLGAQVESRRLNQEQGAA